MASKVALDNAVGAAMASLMKGLAEERANISRLLEAQHQDLAKRVDMELRSGLGAPMPCQVQEAAWMTPTKCSEASGQRSMMISPHFGGDSPINGDEDLGKSRWEEDLGESPNRDARRWNYWMGGCCSPQKAHTSLLPPGLPPGAMMTPPATPHCAKAASQNRWRPSSSATGSSAAIQVIAPPHEESQAEEFYRETMESLRDPLVHKKKVSMTPVELTPLQKMLIAYHFDAVVSVIILANMFFIGYSTEHSLHHWRDPRSSFISAGEWLFLGFFIIELSLRLHVEGCRDFCLGANNSWNGFDSFLIGTTLVSQILESMEMGNGTMKTATSLRTLRLFKMVRMLRALRGAQSMHELRALLSSIASSCRILFWAMIMMLFIYYVFGLVFMNAVAAAMPDLDDHLKHDLLHFYGSIRSVMLTLFMSTTGGIDWSEPADLLWPIGAFYYIVFLFYVSVVSFAIVNLITGLFVDGAMKAAEKDRMTEMQDTKTEADEFKEAVKHLFMQLVQDDDGVLDREELAIAIQEPRMKAFMEWVQYDENEIITLFRILDKAGGSQGVTFDFFVDSCFRFGQRTKGLDLLILLDEQEKVQKQLAAVSKQLKKLAPPLAPEGFVYSPS